jgi:Skp family chaperone for outer membrane proteins
MALGLIVALTGALAHQSWALRNLMARPTAVATIDLVQVIDGMEERAAEDARLTMLAEELQEEGKAKAEVIGDMEEELKAYAVGSDKYQDMLQKWQLESLRYQAFIEFSRRKLDVQKAHSLRRLYRSVIENARALAEADGYDLVLADDSVSDIPMGTEVEVRRRILSRRTLYANPEVDLTDELIARLNEGFLAGG